MASLRKAKPVQRRRSLVSSAALISFNGAQGWAPLPVGDRRWQMEAWRQFDICGELNYGVTWKGNACGQATLYAATIDPDTGRPTGAAENQDVQDVANAVLGGPIRRSQNVTLMVKNLEVAGEVYVIVRQRAPEELAAAAERGDDAVDEWLVISTTQLMQSGKSIEFVHPDTGQPVTLVEGNKVIRVWTRHPQLQYCADSPVRSLLPTLREIEKSSQNIAARLDSRLVGAGVFVIPQEADFQDRDDSEAEETASFMTSLAESMRRSLQEPGSAAAQVPLVVEVPSEFADAFKLIKFDSELNKEVTELREKAIGRVAGGLNLPREVLEGMGDSNHWSAWQVAEETYRTHLLPALDAIADALTSAYFYPMLRHVGIDDVGSYMLAFDGSTIISQPDPLERVIELLDRGLITPEAALIMLSVPAEYAPSDEERRVALATRLVTGAPSLFEQEVLRRVLGFDTGTTAAPPTPEQAAVTAGARRLAIERAPQAELQVASLAVLHALERAGNRMLNTRRLKDEYADVPAAQLYTRVRPDPDRHTGLLEGAWRHIPELSARLRLDDYTNGLLATGTPHSDGLLAEWMGSL
jgi:hypothetical protein